MQSVIFSIEKRTLETQVSTKLAFVWESVDESIVVADWSGASDYILVDAI